MVRDGGRRGRGMGEKIYGERKREKQEIKIGKEREGDSGKVQDGDSAGKGTVMR